MGIPWEAYAAVILEALIPAVALLWARRSGFELSRPRLLLVAWLLVFFVSDIVGYVTLREGENNLWLRYVTSPTSDILILWALSLWQDHPLRRIGIRVAVFLLIPVWLIYAIYEGPGAFGRFSDPLRSIVILLAALVTLVGNSLNTNKRIVQQDWFWVASGIALYFALEAAVGPFVEYVLHQARDVASRAFLFKARIDIVAFLLVAVGLLCPPDPARRSGTST